MPSAFSIIVRLTWDLMRIANELLAKLGLRVSPRTVAKYMPRPAPGRPRGGERWSTFLRNHARGVIACDFLVAVTSTFRVLYVLVVIEHHSRRLIHFNVTAQPTTRWTRQQLREAVGSEERYEYLLHDRDAIFSTELDESIRRLGQRVVTSPLRSPKANAICERVIGTLRRECLDWVIPLSDGPQPDRSRRLSMAISVPRVISAACGRVTSIRHIQVATIGGCQVTASSAR